jgi:hypothetical protein
MVTRSEGGDQLIGLLGQGKELSAKALFHFSGGFIGKGEGHNFRDGQRIWFSQKEVQNSIDEYRGLAGSGSCYHHDIAVPGGLC